MTLWQLIERDHQNIGGLIRDIPLALNDPRAVGGREQMLADLMDELKLHAIAVDASLTGPLSRESQTRALIEELHRGHAEFRRQLQQLAHDRTKASAGWLDTFEDATFLVDQHLHRHVHELIPAAQALFSPEEVAAATRAFVRAKTNALRTRRRGRAAGVMSNEVTLVATLAGVAFGLGYLIWNSGRFGRSRSSRAAEDVERVPRQAVRPMPR
ncbi:hemerythrin domain-containing protein [Methylobacterium sp. J-088]|uniref:hemerythrin domain-containing protein n=1 Tax=Methylobacterium sp. J-088 TaxID=2836664 RepID=UPI001FB961C5|nr:hemerythrin domain-containing protein [Methylobacterium sp. J-088]MCJ2065212.1 hemerythrin domain-containing protein [Methylobacterium sp. J-088]